MPDLPTLLRDAIARFKHMPPVEQESILRAQRDSFVRAELSWPKPRRRIENGTIIYESLEDYRNA